MSAHEDPKSQAAEPQQPEPEASELSEAELDGVSGGRKRPGRAKFSEETGFSDVSGLGTEIDGNTSYGDITLKKGYIGG